MQLKKLFFLNGTLSLLLGIFLFLFPELTHRWIMIIVALQSFISAGYIFASLRRFDQGHIVWSLLLGIAQIIFGVLLIIYPQFGNFLLSLVVVIFALGIIGVGFWLLADALHARRFSVSSWWLLMLIALVVIMGGIFVLTNAFLTYLSLVMLLGLSFAVSWVSLILKGFKLSNGPVAVEYGADE